MIDKVTKFMLVCLAFFLVFIKQYYFILIISFGVFIVYKLNLFSKFSKFFNKVSGNTKNVINDKKQKSKYLSKLSKNSGGEI